MAAVKPTSTNDAEKAIADGKQAQLDAVAAQEARDKIPPSPTQEENDRIALGLPVELADPGESEEKSSDESTEEASAAPRRAAYRNRQAES